MDCKYFEKCCMNPHSNNFGGNCNSCDDMERYFDSTEELLYSHLRLEKESYERVFSDEFDDLDDRSRKHLARVYMGKIKLLEELINEIYG